ncbi:MAG: hypothetical protein ACJ762_08455 [Solirubrobacteraceae bacterium]
MKAWIARIVALLALLGAAAAIYLAITSVKTSHDVTGDAANAAMKELAAGNGSLSDVLEALGKGDSPRAAQAKTRSTADLTRRLDDDTDGEGDMADRVKAVYAAELTYLDAVGSTLNNPSSPLRKQIGKTAQALRDVLQQVPGGDHRAIRGGMALVLYSEARLKD